MISFKTLLNRSLSIVALLLLSACGLPHHLDTTRKSEIRTAAVMVGYANTFSFNERGLFGTKTETMPVDWKLGAYAETQAIAALRPYYDVRQQPYDPGVFNGLPTSSDLTGGTAKEPTARMQSFMQRDRVDMIVLLVNNSSGGYSATDNGGRIGMFYQVILFDGRTLTPIVAEQGGVPCTRPHRPICLNGFDYVGQATSYRWSGDPADKLSPSVKETMRQTMFDLVAESIPHTFARIGLTPRQ